MVEIIITGANANYFELVKGTILSIRQKPQGQTAIIGFFDLGCTTDQLKWLDNQINIIKQPNWEFDFPTKNEAPDYLKGLLARPFLRNYFPNFDTYLWIDGDAWLQEWKAIDLFIQGANKQGLAIVPEINRGSHIQYGGLPEYWWKWTYRQYEESFGEEIAKSFYSYPLLNAGVFALHKDAPHWEIWAECLQEGLQKAHSLMTDQFALNLAVYNYGLFEQTELLPSWCNWTCHFGLPVWDKEKSCLVEPYLPHDPIGILHLTNEKYERVNLVSTDKNLVEVSLRYTEKIWSSDIQVNQKETRQMLEKKVKVEEINVPEGDYVSPGLQIVIPDNCFPHMIIANKDNCPWSYMRSEIPHNWYADERYQDVGFVTRDEAHILYNTALKFKGKNALEIGCWFGWSACHLALAGVQLDIVDPVFVDQEVYESVTNSLRSAGVIDSVKLIKGYSPSSVRELFAQNQKKWSLIFIDGDHEAPAPLYDAIVCEQLAEQDAIILFHDLTSPDVVQGLDYLKQRGWQTMIYQTMQIMGVAWRGNVEPVHHQPDPNVEWDLPAHLQHYSVSGLSKEKRIDGKESNLNLLINTIENINVELDFANKDFDNSEVVKLNQKGKQFFGEGNLEQALLNLKNATEINPLSWTANKYLSLIYWQKGDLKKSLNHYIIASQSASWAISDRTNYEFLKIIEAISSYTMLRQSRLFSLYSLAKQICLEDIPGNFVECGTCRGGAAALLAFAIKRYSQRPRLVYAFDTFEGMPDPTAVDKRDGIPANDTGLGVGTLKASISEGLEQICQALDVKDIVVPVKGLFSETLPKYKAEINKIALLHADGDWYESTMDIFNHLFEQVVDDGIIQIDDYGFWEGCRKAVHDFERNQNITFPLRGIDDTGVWFRKQNTSEYDAWRALWFLAEVSQKAGDVALAEKAALATLKLVPRLVMAEEMLALLRLPSRTEKLNLKEINLIIFPNWNQAEEILLPEIKRVMRYLLAHPERSKIILLIETSEITEESAEMAISGAVMEILYEEDLDVSEQPEIAFLSNLSQREWQELQPKITSKINMLNENEAAVFKVEIIDLPEWQIIE
ncbi:MAG TPA: TylF/MycF/NovP-related O-methyltransferase [Leptolyngbyaceae cyanobacterium]